MNTIFINGNPIRYYMWGILAMQGVAHEFYQKVDSKNKANNPTTT